MKNLTLKITLVSLMIGCLCFTSNMSLAQHPQSFLTGFNQASFRLNEKLDTWFLKPVAKAYNKVVPSPVNTGITNFFNNLDGIPTIINDWAQLKFYQSYLDSWRLLINSTVGIAGLFDPATKIGLARHHEDFGLTLADWGYRDSRYLVLPLIGPSTIRDAIGLPVNIFTNITPYVGDTASRTGVYLINLIDKRAQLLQLKNVYAGLVLDPFIFQKNAYLQHRQYLTKQNNGEQPTPAIKQHDNASNDVYYLE